MNHLKFATPLALACAASLVCITPASAQEAYDDYAEESTNPDPWEPFNRAVFRFNDTVDTYTLKPLAKGYNAVMPEFLNDGVTNVFSNLGEPRNLVNNTLQGKFHDASVDLSRFLLNTTLGVVGVFDVATRMGLQRNDEDLGQTIGSWGTPSGPYVVLPLLGPSTVRDAGSRVPESFIGYTYTGQVDHVPTRNTAFGTDILDTRAALVSRERLIRGDRYAFVRNAYLQNREYRVRDGEVIDEF